MKKSTYLFLLYYLVCSFPAYGNENIEPKSNINHVTIYRQGAEITRICQVEVPVGQSTILLKGLSNQINQKSIQAKLSHDVRLESIFQEIDYLDKPMISKEITAIVLRQRILNDSIRLLKSFKEVYIQEKNMIVANRSIGGTTGVSISELANGANFFRERLKEIEILLYQNKQDELKLKHKLVSISKQLQKTNIQRNTSTSTIKLVISSTAATSCNLEIKYVVDDAGWNPQYDIRVEEIDQDLNLIYKANVYQSTGIDWSNVTLRLSTGNPFISNNKPSLAPYYLTFNNYYATPKSRPSTPTPFLGTIHGYIKGSDGEALIGANVIFAGTTIGTVTDFDGRYEIRVPRGQNQIVVSYTGFDSKKMTIGQSSRLDVKLDEGVYLEEAVIVSGLGSRVSGLSIQKTKKELIPLSIKKHQTSTQFDIEIPYSIPSNNEEYSVTMIEHQIPVKYHYASIPKISEQAFLIAKINNWVQYNLLNGPVNLYFKGIYQGESELLLATVGDTLTISIGRDEDIVVKREIDIDFTNRKIIGTNKRETRGWTVKLKNNKSIPINIIVEDQYPIAKNNQIEVKIDEVSNGSIDETTGIISWNISLGAYQSITKNVRYTVKSPKHQRLLVE